VAVSQTQVNLSWRESTDDVAVAGYRIYRNNIPVAFSLTPSFSDTGLHSTTTYIYSVAAVDTSGNISPKSDHVSGTTF
jgi:chitodextrinase